MESGGKSEADQSQPALHQPHSGRKQNDFAEIFEVKNWYEGGSKLTENASRLPGQEKANNSGIGLY